MQPYLNEMSVLGNLVSEPRLRYFPDGGAVLRITIETCDETGWECDGEDVTCVEYHDAVLYGLLAERIARSARAGARLWICGPLHRRYFADGLTGKSGMICEIETRQASLIASRIDSCLPYLTTSVRPRPGSHRV
ncbi:hypothetical protein W822_03200 [Advenella kashmirensis W13003]|uniref:Single-stranded DNA-binding protein n=1 Tax=Advenella kashmirensis W13003 TaxID=1424334 RepID=V8QYI1_9BURK|nr:single-stranded DNA-binding protein [Advenella kashmirensis]ETF04702.1 hypothetical protein W822_03200 [Advenella kashmirensis W13003]